MHQYLGAIGFSKLKDKEELQLMLEDVIHNPSNIVIYEHKEGSNFAELSKEVSSFMGIAVRGDFDKNKQVRMEYFLP